MTLVFLDLDLARHPWIQASTDEGSPLLLTNVIKRLGYRTYGVVGTDLVYFVSSWMVADVPDSIIGHFLHLMLVQPIADDLEPYAENKTTSDENALIDALTAYSTDHFAYSVVQAQKPLALGLSMADSSVGLAGWIWDFKYAVSDGCPYIEEEIITGPF
ncbi:putative Epoxide hydrolase N-terminal domain-containing protein [Seiridium cardinale]|uniref:Epoxide hydrolase N-terminal domain-containing protein n=1 Tax=Seiridium cardinale TaxID=138064 RepID=A0ABR2Y9D3_9PEZI